MENVLVVILLAAGVLVAFWLWDAWQVKKAKEESPGRGLSSVPNPDSPRETRKDKLERLDELHEQGGIDDEEYEAEKRKIRSEKPR